MSEGKIKKSPKISMIAAITKEGRALGNNGELLFRIPADLARFKALTMGHPLIMGRKTFESIGRSLPGRANIVITRNPDFRAPGCLVVSSLEEGLRKAGEIDTEIFIGGGGEIYQQALSRADKLYLTVVESDAAGDTFFPDWRRDFTKEVSRTEHFDKETGLKYAWIDLER